MRAGIVKATGASTTGARLPVAETAPPLRMAPPCVVSPTKPDVPAADVSASGATSALASEPPKRTVKPRASG